MMKFMSICALLVGMTTGDLPSEWSYQVSRDDSIKLYCNDSSIDITSTEYGEWTVPSGITLSKYLNDTMFEVMTENLVPGYALFVKKVKQNLEGVYICAIKNRISGKLRMTTVRGVNIYQPKAKSLTKQYEYNIIVGFVAAIIFFVPFVGICAIYKFRFKTNEEKAKRMNVRHTDYPNNVSMESPEEVKVQPPDDQFVYENVVSTNL